MAYEYVRVQRNITTGVTPGVKYLAIILRTNTLDNELTLQKIKDKCLLPTAAIEAVIQGLADAIKDSAQKGEALKLDGLGTFYPSISAAAQNRLADVDASTIRDYTMKFFPSKAIKNVCKNTPAKKANLNIGGYQYGNDYLTEEEYREFKKTHNIVEETDTDENETEM